MNISPQREYALDALSRYWPAGREAVLALPMPQLGTSEVEPLPPDVRSVGIPDWAHDVAVDGRLLVPAGSVAPGAAAEWRRTDWLGAAFWYLSGAAERAFERRDGPIHSYSFRLRGWDTRVWDRAWVNRLALFLRRWVSRHTGRAEDAVCGTLPEPQIALTHDIDAVTKTLPIRLKQSAFHVFNALHATLRGDLAPAASKFAAALRFLVSREDYWYVEEIAAAEAQRGVRSCFFVFPGGEWSGPVDWLLDPSYEPEQLRLRKVLRTLLAQGWSVGMHPSFSSWSNGAALRRAKARLERSLGEAVNACRQHWLRFSWERTWVAQASAGFSLDMTLGFNDRPGFRTAAALRYRPWYGDAPLAIEVMPMVLMDSHLYDYQALSDADRQQQITHWLDEVRTVRGEASIDWHTHVLGRDYGWRAGFESVLNTLAEPIP